MSVDSIKIAEKKAVDKAREIVQKLTQEFGDNYIYNMGLGLGFVPRTMEDAERLCKCIDSKMDKINSEYHKESNARRIKIIRENFALLSARGGMLPVLVAYDNAVVSSMSKAMRSILDSNPALTND